MADTPTLHPPKQERSRRTLNRILQAARELVAERGADRTSVQDIVARAGSSVGSFYARFEGKADLLAYLEGRVWNEARERWDRALEERAWDDVPLEDLVPGLVQVLREVERHEGEVRQALRRRRSARADSEPVRAFRSHVHGGIRDLLLAHTSRMAHRDPSRAVDVGLRVVVGGLREMDRSDELSDEEVVAELSRLLLAYLGTERTGPEPRGAPIDFFDIWG